MVIDFGLTVSKRLNDAGLAISANKHVVNLQSKAVDLCLDNAGLQALGVTAGVVALVDLDIGPPVDQIPQMHDSRHGFHRRRIALDAVADFLFHWLVDDVTTSHGHQQLITLVFVGEGTGKPRSHILLLKRLPHNVAEDLLRDIGIRGRCIHG